MTGFSAPLSTLVKVLNAEIAPALEKTLVDCTIRGITTDTRTVSPGELFVALEGERFDGHHFVTQAIEKGVIAAVVHKDAVHKDAIQNNTTRGELPLLTVENTLSAYQSLGRWWRQQCGIPVIAITGSVGKTTTKELLAAALGQFGSVLKTRANFNNEIGVPKTLLELTTDHDYAVVEMGMRGLEEISVLTRIAEPTVGLITNVGTAHIGRLGSRAAIAQAKCELLRELPAEGTAVLNHDDARLMRTAAKFWSGKQITYGFESGDVCGEQVGNCVMVDGLQIPLPLPGRHNALNLLSVIATLQALNLNWRKLAQGFTVAMPAGRSQFHKLPNDILLLDETYNAGAEAMVAALQLLSEQTAKRRIAVLGTMKELGEQSVALHHQIGEAVAQKGIDYLLILADPDEATAMAEGAAHVPNEKFESHAAVVARLQALMEAGDRILFKASRSVEMDKVVEQLLRQSQ
ncbi:MAG: UDP-N-acetylmuramoyl-tripeptide--D-alanyl-D-alanine ligase [Cyanobacteria bacterium P01_D01_bin.105]